MDANIQWIQINVKKTGKTQSVLWEVTNSLFFFPNMASWLNVPAGFLAFILESDYLKVFNFCYFSQFNVVYSNIYGSPEMIWEAVPQYTY
jgi:uncharacterized membrane protein